jgi:hypothetical protein
MPMHMPPLTTKPLRIHFDGYKRPIRTLGMENGVTSKWDGLQRLCPSHLTRTALPKPDR